MPWCETSPMEQRLGFIHEYETDLFTMSELAAQYGISRKTGYKWLERYDAHGVDGLRDQSRRPHESPQATDPTSGVLERLFVEAPVMLAPYAADPQRLEGGSGERFLLGDLPALSIVARAEAVTTAGPERIDEAVVVAQVEPGAARDGLAGPTEEGRELADVFFGFDSWRLTEEARRSLAGSAEWLRAHLGTLVSIEGHCDERGTLAYNFVLGEKRAQAVRGYLIELGIRPAMLQAVSYGKERPFCAESNDRCHRLNRRGHLVVR